MSEAKKKLIEIIQKLDDEVAERLLEEFDDILDDIMLEIELENDPELWETLKSIEDGTAELIPHEEVVRMLGLQDDDEDQVDESGEK